MAVAYFKNKFSPWDGRIALSPATGVTMSGFQVNAKGLMSASIGDSFGGSLSTKNGFLTVSAPKIKICNMSGVAFLTTMTNLTGRLVNAIADTACNAADIEDNEKAEKAASIINDVTGYANSISGIIADSYVAFKNFSAATEKSTKHTRAWVNLAIAAVNIAMSVSDVLENLIACTIIKNADSDYSFVKRTKENNYISGHDIYLMTTSSIRMVAMITNASLLMVDNMSMPKISSLELNAASTDLTSTAFNIYSTMKLDKASAVSGTNTEVICKINEDDNASGNISRLISQTGMITTNRLANVAADVGQQTLTESTISNMHMKNATGDTDIKPMEQKTTGQTTNTTGMKNEGIGSKEGVSGNNNNVNANIIDGTANQMQSNALGTNNQAVGNQLGAMETDAKVMKTE